MEIEQQYKSLAVLNATKALSILNDLDGLVLEFVAETQKWAISFFNVTEKRMRSIITELENQLGSREEEK